MPTLSPQLLGLMLAGSGAALAFIYLARRNQPFGVMAWLLVVVFVPVWVAVPLVFTWPLVALTTLGCLFAFQSVRRPPLRFTPVDLTIAAVFLVAIAPFFVGGLRLSSFFGVLTVWIPCFLLGRLVTPRVGEDWLYGLIAAVFTVVGALAVVEFVTGWHGLSGWGPANSSRATWGSIQARGGLSRSEGAFGHSIALGSSLALAVVCTFASRFRPGVRIVMIGVQLAGAAVTLSRIGIISSVVGLVLAILFLEAGISRAVRWSAAGLLSLTALVLFPFFADVLAASDEAAGSASYRGSLLSLVPFIDLFGASSATNVSASGELYFGSFRSIDSQLVLFGLSYGWMTLAPVLVLLAFAVAAVLGRQASAATVAVVAQIPALMAVALITQYAYFFWFMVGVAAAGHAQISQDRGTVQASGSTSLERRKGCAATGVPKRKEASSGDDC